MEKYLDSECKEKENVERGSESEKKVARRRLQGGISEVRVQLKQYVGNDAGNLKSRIFAEVH